MLTHGVIFKNQLKPCGHNMEEIFENYVETSFDGYQQADFKFKQFEINYLPLFPPPKNGILLDIGIGRGEMLSCMKKWGYDYTGVDISPSTVRFCQSIGLECEQTNDTIDFLQRKPNFYSLITCLDVLEHIPRQDTISFLKAIRHSLAEGGKAIIQVPNLQSPFGYLHHFNDFTHVTGFVEHSLAQVLLSAGFKKFELHGFEEIYQSGAKAMIRKILRHFYRKAIRFLRKINCNPNPAILDPVFYAIVYK